MYYILKFLLFVFSKFPLKLLHKIADMLGLIAWYILPGRRKVAIINAKIIGVKEPKTIAKKSFQSTFRSYLESSFIGNIDNNFLDKYVSIEGEDNLKAISHNKNFAFVSAHIGAWDIATPIFAKKFNYKILIVGRESNSKAINRLIEEKRNDADGVVYVMHKGYLNKIGEYEKLGYHTGSLLDHSGTESDTIIVPFFGLKVRTLSGMVTICVRKKIPILPCYLLRKDDGFLMAFSTPIYPNQNLKFKEQILEMCTQINIDFENIIKRAPEQWYLLHKRFKKVEEPDGSISERIYR